MSARVQAADHEVEPLPENHTYQLAPSDKRNKDITPDDAEILFMDDSPEAADAVTAECWCIIKDIGSIDTVTFTVTIKADMYAVSREGFLPLPDFWPESTELARRAAKEAHWSD